MIRRTHALSIVSLILIMSVPAPAITPQWTATGQALCIASGTQQTISMAPDGAGGAVMVWMSGGGIYAGRVDADGNRLWGLTGVAVCTAANEQRDAVIASDGSGGALVAWVDERFSYLGHIYAQRISAGGTPLWTADGVVVSDTPGSNTDPTIVADGTGGAYVAFESDRSSETYDYVYVQRFDAAGTAQWTANGMVVDDGSTHSHRAPVAVSDGAGGVIVVYTPSSSHDMRAVRLDATGAHQWAPAGVVITDYSNFLYRRIASDGAGGFFFVWGSTDIYAQHVDAGGVLQWTPDPAEVCTQADQQINPRVTADGFGGAVVAWEDTRDETNKYNIYAQRIDASGVRQWADDGVPVVTRTNHQFEVTVVPDATGGAIFTWTDLRAGDLMRRAYSQRVDATGVPMWTDDGVELTPIANSVMEPRAVSDGAGGVIAAWEDLRSSSIDIYGQRLNDLATAASGPATAPRLIVGSNIPNPFRTTTSITFSSPRAGRGDIAIYDVRGRLVERHAFTASPGWQSLSLDASGLANGVYFYRIDVAGYTAARKFVIAR